MKIFKTCRDLLKFRKQISPKHKLGFVPTMGALHAGHLSLVERAEQECDRVVVSIFVNPTQFGPHEDFSKYPRTLKQDLQLLKTQRVDAVFCPSPSEIYSQPNETRILPRSHLDSILEAKFRPGHFEGVCQIVAKLFELVRPHSAYFGEKDYQQLQVIKAMVDDLFMPIKIRGCRTLREKSGLALSSRNRYLNAESLLRASEIYRQLKNAPDLASAKKALQMRGFEIDYLEAWKEDLSRPAEKNEPARWLAAVRFEGVRLIDNLLRR